MALHAEPFAGAGRTYDLDVNGIDGGQIRVEDYWDRVAGRSWMRSEGNPAAVVYALRASVAGLPMDDEVVYGKVGAFGHLVHVSELPDAQDAGDRS